MLAMREDAADVYLYEGDALSAADLLLRLQDAGIRAPVWGGPALARAQFANIAGEAAAATCYVSTDPLFTDLSANSLFARGYRELSGTEPGLSAALAYDAAELLLDALARAIGQEGRPTRAEVVAQLSSAAGPDGERLFVEGRRSGAGAALHCLASR